MGFPDGASGKELGSAGDMRDLDLQVRKIPQRRKWQSAPVFLP